MTKILYMLGCDTSVGLFHLLDGCRLKRHINRLFKKMPLPDITMQTNWQHHDVTAGLSNYRI